MSLYCLTCQFVGGNANVSHITYHTGIYLATIYHLPNRKYFPYMREMSDEDFRGTIGNILLYGTLQLLSFVLLNALLVWKFRLPATSQLAFALQAQWQFIHANLVLWIVYSLQSSLDHVGAWCLHTPRFKRSI